MAENMGTTTIQEGPSGAESDRSGCVFSRLRRSRRLFSRVNPLCALVVSSEEAIQQNLAEMISECRLIAFRAFTVGEGRRILSRQEICLVVCDDRLIDGKYQDLVRAAKLSRGKAPVIVVSLVGDWPDYLKAIDAGAFDFLAYPPVRGEVPRVVRHALESGGPHSFGDAELEHSEFWRGER